MKQIDNVDQLRSDDMRRFFTPDAKLTQRVTGAGCASWIRAKATPKSSSGQRLRTAHDAVTLKPESTI